MQNQSLHFPRLASLGISAILIIAPIFLERTVRASVMPDGRAATSGAAEEVWLVVKVSERRLELVGDYSYRMDGRGRVNFKEGGRVLELPEGLSILVDDKKVEDVRRVEVGETVRVVNQRGETLWKLSPVRGEERYW